MKDDFSIKGEVIAVLEAIEDPTQGKNLLDAHMIEQVDVQSGVVDITVLVELGRTREERFSLEDSIYNKVEEIAGVNEVKVKLTTPKAVAQQKNADPLPEP